MKPGDPPFDRGFDDDPEFDFNIPEKKKNPHMSFLKRSVSCFTVCDSELSCFIAPFTWCGSFLY